MEIDIRGIEQRAVKEFFQLQFLWQRSFDEWELGQGEMLCILHFVSNIQPSSRFLCPRSLQTLFANNLSRQLQWLAGRGDSCFMLRSIVLVPLSLVRPHAEKCMVLAN